MGRVQLDHSKNMSVVPDLARGMEKLLANYGLHHESVVFKLWVRNNK